MLAFLCFSLSLLTESQRGNLTTLLVIIVPFPSQETVLGDLSSLTEQSKPADRLAQVSCADLWLLQMSIQVCRVKSNPALHSAAGVAVDRHVQGKEDFKIMLFFLHKTG